MPTELFKPGQTPGPGRPKGSVDRYQLLRRAFFDAAIELGIQLQKKAGEEPNKTKALQDFIRDLMVKTTGKEPGNLLRTMASLLPKEIKGDIDLHGMWREVTVIVAGMDRVTMPTAPVPVLIEAGDNGGNGGNGSHDETEGNRIA